MQGVTKYLELLRLSKLSTTHRDFRYLYLSNEFRKSERQVSKYLSKMSWYEPKGEGVGGNIVKWMRNLKLQVSSSENSLLLKALSRDEPKRT